MPFQLYIEYSKDRLVPGIWMNTHDVLEFDDVGKLLAYLDIIQDKFHVYHVKKIY